MTMQSAIFYIAKIVDSATFVYIMWFGIYQSNFKNDIRLIILLYIHVGFELLCDIATD